MMAVQDDDSDWVAMLPIILRNWNECWSRVTGRLAREAETLRGHHREAEERAEDGAHEDRDRGNGAEGVLDPERRGEGALDDFEQHTHLRRWSHG